MQDGVTRGAKMEIIIGADHGGYEFKEEIKKLLDAKEVKYTDVGTDSETSTDYPDYAHIVAKEVAESDGEKQGILICGTGLGMSMAANKHQGIRAALCHNEFTAQMSREHNDANILCLGGRVLELDMAKKIVGIWLDTKFSDEERHNRRIEKVDSV